MVKELVDLLDSRMKAQASGAIQGVPCVLGTMTANGVKLDDFKHEITDPLYLEPLTDIDIEVQLVVPAHEETGKLVINSPTDMPVSADGNPGAAIGYVTQGAHTAKFQFDSWTYNAESLGKILATKARVKFKPEYKEGDRVLCVLVNSGQDVVIVSRVVN